MKCPNCGSEIGASKVCEYCGTPISLEMQREQEELRKAGCPKCGSSNIAFRRENQGEIRDKHSKQVIHRTVGYCKDCGATWYTSGGGELPKKRKTWLWVLGWIFIFPVPLTILMLRNKEMKPAIKYGIIVLAWVLYLGIGYFGGDDNKTTEPVTGTAVEETQTEDTLDVTLDVQPKVNEEDGSVLFGIETNLPERTEFIVTVTDGTYNEQDNAVVLNNGFGYTSEFSDGGKALKGDYTVTVTMSIPSLQKGSVREIIGDKGEKLSGKYVTRSETDDSNIVVGEFEFTF